MKTPGVYITEKNAFPNSIAEVATAVPAFIGYTEKAENAGKSLQNTATRITSMGEYIQLFGGAPKYQYLLSTTSENKGYSLKRSGEKYNLFNSMRLFFENGGAACYIISVGSYNDPITITSLMDNGLSPLLKEEEPTMVIVPEAVYLKEEDCTTLQRAVLNHCGTAQNRIGVLDIYDGYKARNHSEGDVIDNFRNALPEDSLSYGVAYYPWLNTTVVSDSELGLANLTNDSLAVLKDLMLTELNVPVEKEGNEAAKTTELREILNSIPCINEEGYKGPGIQELDKILIAISPTYNDIRKDIKTQLNLLAPGAAMAGIYTQVDNERGVWKAPANVPLNAVVSPSVNISHHDQEDLNVTLNGKSINAIRAFADQGVMVWGARTLDGNSRDWRYINVRRTMIMLEQSIKVAAKAYVFEPNDAGTWTVIKSMIDSFLFDQWKQGALVGASPHDAYAVSVGLGSTMTAIDILDGILRISVLVAVSRPSEFLEITFQQQMQKS